MRRKTIFIYRPTAAAADRPHLRGLPYGLRIRLRTPYRWGGEVYAETLSGQLIGLVPSACLDRA
jgi:hypothetical protein